MKFVSTVFVPIPMGSCAAQAKWLLFYFFLRFHLNLHPLLCLLNFMKILRRDGRTDSTVLIGAPDGCQSRSDRHILDPCHFVDCDIFRLFSFNQRSAAQSLYYIPPGVTFKNCTHDVFTCST